METLLILFTLKVLASQLEDLPIVPPKKPRRDDVEEPGDDYSGPVGFAPHVRRTYPRQLRCIWEVDAFRQVDGYQDAAANDRHYHEHVAQHPRESHKHRGVHPHKPNQVLL